MFGKGSALARSGSVSRRADRKAFRLLRLSCSRFNEIVFLIIPWSQVRVLAGPPSPSEIIALMAFGPGDRSPLVHPMAGRRTQGVDYGKLYA